MKSAGLNDGGFRDKRSHTFQKPEAILRTNDLYMPPQNLASQKRG